MSGIAITFPSSPIEGQSYLAQNGFTYVYDSLKNRWKRGGDFVRSPKVLSYAGTAVTTTGSGITTGPSGALIYNVPGFVVPNSTVGVDSFKAYRFTDSYPDYTEVQVSISSAFSTIAYAATFAGTTHTIPAATLSGDTTYYVRARQFVGSSAGAAATGAISGYSQNPIRFITTSIYLDTPTIVSIAATTSFPAYNISIGGTTLPTTVTYAGSGVNNLQQVDYIITGPRVEYSTGATPLAEVGIGTLSSTTLANALVLALPFSGGGGVGVTSEVNNAIRSASGASAGNTKTITNSNVGLSTIVGLAGTASFYPSAANFNGSNSRLTLGSSSDYQFGTGNFTIECWFYTNSTSRQALYHGSDSVDWSVGIDYGYLSQTLAIWASSNGSSWNLADGDSIANRGNTIIPPKTWVHVAYVRNSTQLMLFVNGKLDKVFSVSTSTIVDRTGYSPVIGDWYSATSMPFNGYIQDFKIYKGVAKYQSNFTPPLPSYGTISYATGISTGSVGVATTAFFVSTGDTPLAEVAIGSSTAADVANSLVLALPMNKPFGFQDINVAIRSLTSGASAGTAKTVGLGTTSVPYGITHPRMSSLISKWYDSSVYFDGPINTNTNNADYLTIPNSTDFDMAGDFTWECWAYPTQLPASDAWPTNFQQHSVLFGRGTPSLGDGWGLIIGATKLIIQSSDSQIINATHNIAVNNWYHVCATRSGSTVRLFVNGMLIGSTTNSSSFGGGSNFYIGGETGQGAAFVGYMQDLKIYKGFAKYTANFTPPSPICGFSTNLAIQSGFTTTTATGIALTSIVGLGSTSTLGFAATSNYQRVTSITSSSGITTLPDPYAQNLVLALPLSDISGAGGAFSFDRNTQIRSVSLVGGGSTKNVTNSGVSTNTTSKWYSSSASFTGTNRLQTANSADYQFGTGDFTIECWVYPRTISGYDILVKCSNDTTWANGWVCTLLNGKINFYVSSHLTGSVTMTANTWNHVAWVRRNGVLNQYVNGILDRTDGLGSNLTPTDNLSVGNDFTDNAYGSDCNIQDLRIYKGAAKYQENFTPPPPMFGDYTRSSSRILFTPSSDYSLEVRNTATPGIITSSYSASRQWGTAPKLYPPDQQVYSINSTTAIVNSKTGYFDPAASAIVNAFTFDNTTSNFASNVAAASTGTNYSTTAFTNSGYSFNTTNPTPKWGNYTYTMGQTGGGGGGPYFNMTIPDNSAVDWSNGYTLECWLYPTAFGGGGWNESGYIFQGWGNYRGYLSESNPGSVTTFYFSDANNSLIYTPTINTWMHVAMVGDPLSLRERIYINGSMIGYRPGTITSTNLNNTTSNENGRGNSMGYRYAGYYQDYRVYNYQKYH